MSRIEKSTRQGDVAVSKYTIGLDFGTNSVRALLVDTKDGREIATSVFNYPTGQAGIILDPKDPNVARQNPRDYIDGTVQTVRQVMEEAETAGIAPSDIIGVGIDTTGSTPIPVDEDGTPLYFNKSFSENPAAAAWLWKDHTAYAEAAEITALAAKERPQYLAKCGSTYSSEWYWSKLLRCARTAPDVFSAAYTWVEHADWMPALLTGNERPADTIRCICAAGHKAMFHESWGGYPDEEFLGKLHPELARVRKSLPNTAGDISKPAGKLTAEWAQKLGLAEGIPVAVGAFDAHLGAVGSGIQPGVLVKIIGTSCCDMAVAPLGEKLPDIPGLCGIVPGSIIPGMHGLEAGQSAVGDIFNWFVNHIRPDGKGHVELTKEADALRPGESGLLALDWNNGNRTVLVDPRLTGMMLGTTLHTKPAEMYRALVESTAFGARVIMQRFLDYGVAVERVVNCGGIAEKNPMVMQIYADVMGRPIQISRSAQTCALGAAMAGAVVAGAHADFAAAAGAMTGVKEITFNPIPENQNIYDRLFALYMQLHDGFGIAGEARDLSGVMKGLLAIRDEVRK